MSPAKEIITQNKAFEQLCYDDYKSRLESRKNYGRLIVALLIIQNLSIYTLIGYLAGWNITALQHLQWLFSILMSGTLQKHILCLIMLFAGYSMKLITNLLCIPTDRIFDLTVDHLWIGKKDGGVNRLVLILEFMQKTL